MQEEKNLAEMSVEEQFNHFGEESLQEAESRSIEESKSFAKTEYFRMDKMGTYNLRFLPIAPNKDGSPMTRKGYEYPVHQIVLEIASPAKAGKSKSVYVSVSRATDAGYSVDAIDTFKKASVEAAKANDDDKLAEQIAGGSFGGGLKYNYGHAALIYDRKEKAKGIQLLTLSQSQFKDLDDSKLKLWKKKCEKNKGHKCPVSSISNAYPVEIEKKKDGSKTVYKIAIDNESDYEELSSEELTALINAPRIPEVVYRYTRYHLEATIEFLKQFDERSGLNVFNSEEVQSAIAQLSSELPAGDTSSFSFDKKKKDGENGDSANEGDLTFDKLCEMYDDLTAKKLNDKTPEGQELRGLLRQFIDQEGLDIKMTRNTTNSDILDLIEAEMSDDSKKGEGTEAEQEAEPEQAEEPEQEEPQAEEAPTTRQRVRRSK